MHLEKYLCNTSPVMAFWCCTAEGTDIDLRSPILTEVPISNAKAESIVDGYHGTAINIYKQIRECTRLGVTVILLQSQRHKYPTCV